VGFCLDDSGYGRCRCIHDVMLIGLDRATSGCEAILLWPVGDPGGDRFCVGRLRTASDSRTGRQSV
jgi:hypothetical protein